MRKSNCSDLPSALAMSPRESVRRLLESAMMKARAVISEMNTVMEMGKGCVRGTKERKKERKSVISEISFAKKGKGCGVTPVTYFRKLYRREWVLSGSFEMVWKNEQ